MASDVQLWRPSKSMRVAGGFCAAVGSVLVAACINWGVKGEEPALTVVAAAMAAAVLAALGVGYLLRYQLTLGNGELTVVGLWRTHRIALRHVVQAHAARSGIVFLLDDGRRIRARAAQTAAYRRWLHDYTPADDIADEVIDAAVRARGGRPAVFADAQVLRRNAARGRNAFVARATLSALIAVIAIYTDLHSSNSPHAGAASQSSPSLRVGECFTSSELPSAKAAVSCASPHTAQIFAVSRTTPTGTCDRSLIVSSALPPDASSEIVYLVQNGEPTTLCLVVTASITRSLVDTP